MPRYLYPKLSTQAIEQSKGFDPSVPSPLSQAYSRRMVEQQEAERKAKDMKLSPLDRAVAGLEATALMGSAMFEGLQQLPKLMQGEDAYMQAVGNRMYTPRLQPEKAYEYAQNAGDFLDQLQTDYKLPPIMPELAGFQPLVEPAKLQAKRGAERAGMAVERALEKPVTDIMNRGGFGAEALGSFNTNPAQVVKEKGGNWITGSVESATNPLKVTHQTDRTYDPAKRFEHLSQYTPEFIADRERLFPRFGQAAQEEMEQLKPKVAINNWIDQKLNKYIKNEMGTPEDPIRALAEQGISHLPLNDRVNPPSMLTTKLNREEAGFPREGLAQSDLAKQWEAWTDTPISYGTAGEMINTGRKEPWMEKVDPFTRVHEINPVWSRHIKSDLGFDHIIDVLKEDLATGRITPEQLNKISVPDAVRRTHQYNEELAAKMADARGQARKDLPVLKEYPEGYRWVELNKPGTFASESDAMGHSVRGYEPPPDHPDWVEASGEKGYPDYGHGGWEAIKSGKAKVYSLVDKNNNPHVTVEVGSPQKIATWQDVKERGGDPLAIQIEAKRRMGLDSPEAEREAVKNANGDQRYEMNRQLEKHFTDIYKEQFGELPREITQIKGKQNAEPKEEYKPYVRDLQRTTGHNIGGDFQNSGFEWQSTGPRGIFDEDQVKTLQSLGHDVPKYLTDKEKENLIVKLYEHETGNDFNTGNPLTPPEEGMKAGGKVHISDNPDVMRMELQDKHLAGGGLLKKAIKASMMNPEMLVPATRAATKFGEEAPKVMKVIKEKGGNWQAGSIEKATQPLKSKGASEADRAWFEQRREQDPEAYQRAMEVIPRTEAINNWVDRNLTNYFKNEMATPQDPVRLLLDRRRGEIEAKFAKDQERAQRMADRAAIEPDPRRQANLSRQAQQMLQEATADRDIALSNMFPLKPEDLSYAAEPSTMAQRVEKGFPEQGMATSPEGKAFENIADEIIFQRKAKEILEHKKIEEEAKQLNDQWLESLNNARNTVVQKLMDQGVSSADARASVSKMSHPDLAMIAGDDNMMAIRDKAAQADALASNNRSLQVIAENPWIEKVDPETSIYKLSKVGANSLNLDHVIDVLKEDLATGRLTPESLNKVSMEQAIRRTQEYDIEMAKKMREAAIKNQEGFPVHKEYPEGYKWIELTLPEKGEHLLTDLDRRIIQQRQAENPVSQDLMDRTLDQRANEKLAEALKYEGETMGHCVGGYCPDVVSGRSRIYSLRDAKGEPHVTIEVNPSSQRIAPRHDEVLAEMKASGIDASALSESAYDAAYEQALQRVKQSRPPEIVQIKGKQNRAPKEEYLPYVQDFVRSGQWSDVGDLRNTGLRDIEADQKVNQYLKNKGIETQKYITEDEYQKFADDYLMDQLYPPEEGMKRGGKVSISDNPDTMMMELEDQKFGVGGAVIKRVLAISDPVERAAKATQLLTRMATSGETLNPDAHRALLKAQSGPRSLPTVLPRAKPRTKEEIQQFAQKTADQLNAIREGRFLRDDPEGASINAAGKSKKQWEMEQGLTHDIRPLGTTLEPIKTANIEDQLGMLKMGISGDTSISDAMLHRAGPYALHSASEQQGGPFFGLRKRPDPMAWASNEKVLEGLQSDVGEFSRAYGDVPVIGQYKAMGPQGTNFAQHFADANLEAIASANISPNQIDELNNLIRKGNAKSGVHADFPGVEDPGAAYFYFSFYPELRKHFNSIMVKPEYTQKLGLPDGRVILHAITDPELRDMPVLTSGKAQYQLMPSQNPKSLPLSEHSTYTHNLPRDPNAPVTQTPFPVPAELEFSDVVEYAKPRYKPAEMTRVLQTSSPRQIVDPQHIDEIKTFEDFMRQYAPESEKKKTGGLIKVKRKVKRKAAGGAVYNTSPDMSDGGQIIQGDAFKRGGKVQTTRK